jgi:excisionase family DNA binding protein
MEENNNLTTDLLSESEAASLLRMHRITLLRLRKRGQISHYRVGGRIRYTPEHIQDFLERSHRQAERK